MSRRIVCAVSGVALSEDDEAVLEELSPSDSAPELPVGWTRIPIENRIINPTYEAIQFVKAGLVSQILAQFSPQEQLNHEEAVAIQIDAQFAALENRDENVATLLNKIEVYVAPPERVPGLDKELEKVFSVFGLEVSVTDDDDDGDDDGDGDEEAQEDEEESGGSDQSAPGEDAPKKTRRRKRR